MIQVSYHIPLIWVIWVSWVIGALHTSTKNGSARLWSMSNVEAKWSHEIRIGSGSRALCGVPHPLHIVYSLSWEGSLPSINIFGGGKEKIKGGKKVKKCVWSVQKYDILAICMLKLSNFNIFCHYGRGQTGGTFILGGDKYPPCPHHCL